MASFYFVILYHLSLWSLLNFYGYAYPNSNYEILRAECVKQTKRDFDNSIAKQKETKITVNGKQLGYYGFENSANSVVLLDVSNTNVQLPKMNISFTNLIMLHASYNGLEKIDDIGNETFPSLKFLNLSHNAIWNMRSNLFKYLSEIEVLDLSHNCFTHFNYDNILLKHENVKKLYLHDNLIYKIHATLQTHDNILYLDLMDISNNFIENFDNINIQIKELILANNSLAILKIYHADAMKLNAKHNKITSFSGNGNFEIIDLSFNNIKYLSQIEIVQVNFLYLSHNQIEQNIDGDQSKDYDSYLDITEELSYDEQKQYKETSPKSNENTIFVNYIDLSYNKLKFVSELNSYRAATHINLEGNFFKNLDLEEIRKKFKNLKFINFINNPLTTIDIDEMKFYNDTQFLNMYIDYQNKTYTPKAYFSTIVSEIQKNEINDSTTDLPLNTTELSTMATIASNICIKHDKKIILKDENAISAINVEWNYQQQYWTRVFGIFAIIGFMMLIIYNKQQRKTQMRYMNREFNEAENFC